MSGKNAVTPLETLVQAVQESAKYRHVSPDLIRAVGQKELAATRSTKEAVKATKNKLHQVAGAYLDDKMRYGNWLTQLQEAKSESEAAFRETCLEVMRHHASTRERLPILSEFYQTIFAALPPVHSVLDVACGLNSLCLPWMGLAPEARYLACDLFADLRDFLNEFFSLVGIDGLAEARDVITLPPTAPVDLALVLKVLPPLEQVDKLAGLRLLKSLNARYLLVSFPTQSLGGRSKQMASYYEAHFLKTIAAESWQVQRFVFPTELCFLLTTQP